MSEHIVLIIDDEKNVLNSLKRLLRKEPYTVVATTDPEEGFRLLERVKVSLVITDQRMEGFDGDEVIHKVIEKCPGVKCIKLTGYADTTGAVPANGAWRVVPKPWNDDEIKKTIRHGLGIRDEVVAATAINISIVQEDM